MTSIRKKVLSAEIIFSTLLLLKMAFDLISVSSMLSALMGAAIAFGLVLTILNILNQHDAHQNPSEKTKVENLLVAIIPAALLSSALDCTGIYPVGCSVLCTIFKLVLIPSIFYMSYKYYLSRDTKWLMKIAILSFLLILPNCVCKNAVNIWWIDRIGASPACYGLGFFVSVVALASLFAKSRQWQSIALCYLVVIGELGFAIGHHLFHFPW